MGWDFVSEVYGVQVEGVFVCISACKWDVEVLLLPSGDLCQVEVVCGDM